MAKANRIGGVCCSGVIIAHRARRWIRPTRCENCLSESAPGDAPSSAPVTRDDMGIDLKTLFAYDAQDSQAILDSIGLAEGVLAEKLLEMCRLIAQVHLDNVQWYRSYPRPSDAQHRVSSILFHLSEAMRHAKFDGDYNQRDKFWASVFVDSAGEAHSEGWGRWLRLTRSLEAAHHLLRRFAERKLKALQSEKDGSVGALEAGYLRQLSCAYTHILSRKPGRSKSTIGPFVRFAWAAMRPVLLERAPTIETLNERWARLKYDPSNASFDPRALEEMKRDYRRW